MWNLNLPVLVSCKLGEERRHCERKRKRGGGKSVIPSRIDEESVSLFQRKRGGKRFKTEAKRGERRSGFVASAIPEGKEADR